MFQMAIAGDKLKHFVASPLSVRKFSLCVWFKHLPRSHVRRQVVQTGATMA